MAFEPGGGQGVCGPVGAFTGIAAGQDHGAATGHPGRGEFTHEQRCCGEAERDGPGIAAGRWFGEDPGRFEAAARIGGDTGASGGIKALPLMNAGGPVAFRDSLHCPLWRSGGLPLRLFFCLIAVRFLVAACCPAVKVFTAIPVYRDSRLSNLRLRPVPQRYPSGLPFLWTTRWQGTSTARLFDAQAVATARTADCCPIERATS